MKRVMAIVFASALAFSLVSCAEPELSPSSTTAESSALETALKTTAEQSTLSSTSLSSTVPTETTKPTTLRPRTTTISSSVRQTTEKRATAAPTTQSPQKAAAFTFSQTFPLEITSYGARFQILDAKITAVNMDADGGCTFDFVCNAKRLEDGIVGKKTCAIRIKWLNESGEQVKTTAPAIGSLDVGETGRCNTSMGMKPSEMQGSADSRFTVLLEGYGEA